MTYGHAAIQTPKIIHVVDIYSDDTTGLML